MKILRVAYGYLSNFLTLEVWDVLYNNGVPDLCAESTVLLEVTYV